MTWTQTLHTAWSAVRSHTLRSTLTILGILIGIAAVILTVGLGLGSQKDVSARINSLGSNLLIVTPGSSTSTTGVRGGFGSNTTLKRSDAVALTSKDNAPDIAAVAPEKSTQLSLVNGTTNWTTTVTGTTASWLGVRARQLSAGQFITVAQDTARADVVVLGADTATQLYGTTNAVGRTVTINNVEFTVIGVLSTAGSSGNTSLDDLAVVPLSTAAEQLVGGSTRDAVSRIYIEAASAQQLSGASQEATQLLLNLHSITTASSADFTVSSQESLVSTATAVARTLTVLLTGIAALSLLVGGIGVMNIMLVSVTERTREIGLRKALGAPPWAIRRQFLVEASILGLAGGLLGCLLGVVSARTLPKLLNSTIVVSGAAVAGSVVVAVAIGLVFGVYPATRAARLAPIDALRSE
ncbi:MAG: macrolide ABC transporter permease [Cellulomonas sp. 73-145]|uniref:ABC transporter permease n=1 Tax=Cellulomonas sp. 73-145 TaxID=1895739 RepID=UPI00092AB5F8|nr:ABC transporter permease [Cellulomonas sp. 73-145]MBN9326598.1 ABC transporter permease [Cellulomonas sp.]OJV60370.1 MAG: macrolide ABC transporter permease [Cellulomonas sp. 73-145]